MTMVIGNRYTQGGISPSFFIPTPEAIPSTFKVPWLCDTVTVRQVAQRGL
jgi:hypothetical protein